MAVAASLGAIALVLDQDPDLGSGIETAEWESARRSCRGTAIAVPRGIWNPWETEEADTFAWILVEGMLCREVALRDRRMLELLGPGDVLMPPADVGRLRLGGSITFTAVGEVELIAFGELFVRACGRWPSLLVELQRRIETQRHALAIQGLIAHLPRAEHRVLLVLRHLADRWGRVSSDGIILPLPLTHDLLGQLSASRRPTVTLAVRALESECLIERRDDGSWLLRPDSEQVVDAIAATRQTVRVVGESLRLRRRANEELRDYRALRAEARQIRARKPG